MSDNPALAKAVASGQPLICLYVLDDKTAGSWRMGAASLWWLHHSLAALDKGIRALGGSLVLRRGAAAEVLPQFVREAGASQIHWNRCYEPDALARDKALAARFNTDRVAVHDENASLLVEPWSVKTKGGEPYKVFTPFWRACQELLPPLTLKAAPKALNDGRGKLASDKLDEWRLLPTKPNWATGFSEAWTPGEDGAKAALATFLDEALSSYATGHDRPDRPGTSRLSPHLHFGEIGPRQVMRAVRDLTARNPALETVAEKFLSEIGWREFSAHLLWQQPALPDSCFRPEYNEFPWTNDREALKTWQRGMTGWPIVDAGMRQLWRTGWMHNRVRMIVASVLVKHLLVPWQLGEQWFWDTLVDADLASNAANWQWVAGCGADAAPYFRIFNPVLQGEKFDPDGAYVREFVPELAKLPNKFIHKPWEAGAPILRAAGVKLGATYPEPIIDLQAGRERALSAFAVDESGMTAQKIAIIGAGIAGLAAAWTLGRQHDVTVYEKDGRLGGHANTVDVDYDGVQIAVDTGFIVYNKINYPNLVALFDAIGVETHPSDMSFGVSFDNGWLEWAGDSVGTLFAQKRNLLRLSHHAMWRDILRFNTIALRDIAAGSVDGLTLGAYLDRRGFGTAFRDRYLLPMGAAIWSMPNADMLGFPAKSFLEFFENHGLLSGFNTFQWRTVTGGSRSYVAKLAAAARADFRTGSGATRVTRTGDGVEIVDATGETAHYDQVVLACHSDQALTLLGDGATRTERELLGAIRYAPNRAVLHRDSSLMPKRRAVWSSWNYVNDARPGLSDGPVSLTYWMNRLQGIDLARPLFVTLNPAREPRPELTFAMFDYDHPQFDHAADVAQRRLQMIQGTHRTWFCGAYCGHGFHEDGLASALEVASRLGAPAPWGEAGRRRIFTPLAEAAE